jgi:hypothetical protein
MNEEQGSLLSSAPVKVFAAATWWPLLHDIVNQCTKMMILTEVILVRIILSSSEGRSSD